MGKYVVLACFSNIFCIRNVLVFYSEGDGCCTYHMPIEILTTFLLHVFGVYFALYHIYGRVYLFRDGLAAELLLY